MVVFAGACRQVTVSVYRHGNYDALTNNPFSCIAGEGGERSEPDEGEARKRPWAPQAARPSPSHFVGPSLSRGAGEGFSANLES